MQFDARFAVIQDRFCAALPLNPPIAPAAGVIAVRDVIQPAPSAAQTQIQQQQGQHGQGLPPGTAAVPGGAEPSTTLIAAAKPASSIPGDNTALANAIAQGMFLDYPAEYIVEASLDVRVALPPGLPEELLVHDQGKRCLSFMRMLIVM